MTNELASMYYMRLKLQCEHASSLSVEYDKPQFEQTTLSSIFTVPERYIKTTQTSLME